jgi:hypothetical protein
MTKKTNRDKVKITKILELKRLSKKHVNRNKKEINNEIQ